MEIRFTRHSKERMEKRKISEDEIAQTVKYPDKLTKIEGNYYAQKNIGRAKIEVVYEKDKYIKIITFYYL